MPKRNSNGFEEPLPPEVTMNEPAKLDPQARARRKTAVLWFVAVTFGTMALLSLPIGRLITNGLGKGGLLHHALGPVERLFRPTSGWEPPPAPASPPSVQIALAGPVPQHELFRTIESQIPGPGPGPGPTPVLLSRAPSIKAVAPRPIDSGSDKKQGSEGSDHRPHRPDESHPPHPPHPPHGHRH
jgi:hypothetical protein